MNNKISLLLVDDHPVVRAGYRQLISEFSDINVIAETGTGEQACQLYKEQRPNVVIMDLGLPGISGLVAIQRIVKEHSNAKIIAFSIHDEVIYLERALIAGAKGYLSKSCDPDQLLIAIKKVAQGGQYIEPLIEQKWQQKKLTIDNKSIDSVKSLSPREFDVYCQLLKGKTSSQIAASLSLSIKTVANYTTKIKNRFAVNTVAELVYVTKTSE